MPPMPPPPPCVELPPPPPPPPPPPLPFATEEKAPPQLPMSRRIEADLPPPPKPPISHTETIAGGMPPLPCLPDGPLPAGMEKCEDESPGVVVAAPVSKCGSSNNNDAGGGANGNNDDDAYGNYGYNERHEAAIPAVPALPVLPPMPEPLIPMAPPPHFAAQIAAERAPPRALPSKQREDLVEESGTMTPSSIRRGLIDSPVNLIDDAGAEDASER